MMKKLLFAFITLVVLLLLLSLLFLWRLDIDNYRADIEAVIHQQTGLTAKLDGGLTLELAPTPVITVKEAKFFADQHELMRFSKLQLSAEWRPLLKRELVVTQIVLDNPVLALIVDQSGKVQMPQRSVEKGAAESSAPGVPLATVLIENITVNNLTFSLQQVVGIEPTQLLADNLNLNLKNLLIAKKDRLLINQWPEYLNYAHLELEVEAGQLVYGKHRFEELQLRVSNQQQQIDSVLTTNGYGGTAEVTTRIDWLPKQLSGSALIKGAGLEIDDVLRALELEPKGQGHVNLVVDATAELDPAFDPLQTLKADIVLDGKDLTLEGLDLDRLVNKLLESQQLNLKDMGGLALAGPLGLALTKGGSYGSLINSALGGRTRINDLYGYWHLVNQRLSFNDVAFTTDNNRIAATGGIKVAEQKFDPVNIYLLNKKGCHQFHQKIEGTVNKPQLQAANFAINSIVNPMLSLAKRSGALVVECKPVYQGKVAHPERSR